MVGGARGDVRAFGMRFGGEVTVGRRLNYLFQDNSYSLSEPRVAIDVQNVTVEFQLSR